MMNRREAIQTTALLTAVAATTALPSARALGAAAPAAPEGPHKLAPLPYPVDALEPHIDAQTMNIHRTKHHQAYINNVNAALEKHPALAAKSVEDLVRGLDRKSTRLNSSHRT